MHGKKRKLTRGEKAEVRSIIAGYAEPKWGFGSPAAAAITDGAPFIGAFCGLAGGSAYNQRVGAQVAWYHFYWTVILTSHPNLLGDTQVRLVVLVDNQNDEGAGIVQADLFPPATAVNAYWRMPWNRNQVGVGSNPDGKRYHVKYDKHITLAPRAIATSTNLAPSTTAALVPDSSFTKVHVNFHGLRTQYTDAVAGAAAEVIDRTIYFCAFTDATTVGAVGPMFGIAYTKQFVDV